MSNHGPKNGDPPKIKYCPYCNRRMRAHQSAHAQCLRDREHEDWGLGNAKHINLAADKATSQIIADLCAKIRRYDPAKMSDAELADMGLSRVSAIPKVSRGPSFCEGNFE